MYCIEVKMKKKCIFCILGGSLIPLHFLILFDRRAQDQESEPRLNFNDQEDN